VTSPPSERTPWDGRGLPPSAHDRIERSRRSRLTASMLSVGGEVGLDAVGFDPVGEVMGSCVMHLGYAGAVQATYSGARTVTSGSAGYSGYSGYGPYVRALDHAYATALDRMGAEAHGLDAHGVVGVRLVEDRLDDSTREITAIGTAVRGRVPGRAAVPQRPFSTQLPGAEVAVCLLSGWVPTSIAVAISIGVRYDDYRTRNQLNAWSNGEVDGFTDLVTATRSEARQLFRRRLAQAGATRAYVDDMRLLTWQLNGNGSFLVAEATVVGGGLVDFTRRGHRPVPRSTLTVMSVKGAGRLP
jgi:uncharacterized protein YbjQ (UPF0145 family)